MKIKQDPVTKLWAREDGAILMPPSKGRFKTFRWTFGTKQLSGHHTVWRKGKTYFVHQIVCRAFNGLPPEDKPFCDHINRVRHCNRYDNLRWVSAKENSDNADRVDESIAKYGVRCCEDKAAYMKAYIAAHREEHYARNKAYRKRRKTS